MTDTDNTAKPNTLVVKSTNRWLLRADKIDAYLVTAVELPRAQYVGNTIPCVSFSHLKVEVFEPAGKSMYDTALTLLKSGEPQTIEFVMLDGVGNDIETWKMSGTVFSAETHRMSYGGDTSVMKTTISFTIRTLDIFTSHQ